jgi:hypothetical protein
MIFIRFINNQIISATNIVDIQFRPVCDMIINSEIGIKSIWALWVFAIFIAYFVFSHLFVEKYFIGRVMEALALKWDMGNDISVVNDSDNTFYSAF